MPRIVTDARTLLVIEDAMIMQSFVTRGVVECLPVLSARRLFLRS
jgi:hypothetical protein